MFGKLQFSLKYLLADVLMFAMAMGLTRVWFIVTPFRSSTLNLQTEAVLAAWLLVAVLAGACWGAAFGGLFGNMKVGARIAAGWLGFAKHNPAKREECYRLCPLAELNRFLNL
jgi:hypothetical protein